jgi:hypothetical protein
MHNRIHHTVKISNKPHSDASESLAGKTYTLIGNTASTLGATSTGQDNNKERGIIPRAAELIFAKQAGLDPQKVMCQVRMSILEVYQEQLKDLLRVSMTNGPGAGMSAKDTNGLRIREQIDGTVWVENLTELVVTEDGDFNRLLSGALRRRVVGAHSMNDVSSRSHFCCILNINQVFHATGVKINSKIHFIDLAGSEMVSWVLSWLVLSCLSQRGPDKWLQNASLLNYNIFFCNLSFNNVCTRRCARQMQRACVSRRQSTSTSRSARWAT